MWEVESVFLPMIDQQQHQKQEVSLELALLSVDLDDTLHSTGDVIWDANNAMIQAMRGRGCNDVTLDVFLENIRSNRKTDPLEMTNSLALFFDFRISGNDQDILPHGKPHPFVFQKASKEENKR